ncbi:MAG: hypothetical protein ABWZ65_10470 [Pseudomonas mandelii]
MQPLLQYFKAIISPGLKPTLIPAVDSLLKKQKKAPRPNEAQG